MTAPRTEAVSPHSSPDGRSWVLAWLRELHPASVLDVGPGSGAVGHLARKHLPGTHLAAVEIWGPYVARFSLRAVYDTVDVADARTATLPEVDVVVLGGVLDCMPEPEAVELWRRCRNAARMGVLLSVSVAPPPRSADDDNPHGARAADGWTHDRVTAVFDGILAYEAGREVGAYLAGGLA